MTGRPFLVVEIASRSAAYVSGPNARRLLIEAGAKSPMWLPRRRVWATSPKVARDLLALADARSIPVRFTDAQEVEA